MRKNFIREFFLGHPVFAKTLHLSFLMLRFQTNFKGGVGKAAARSSEAEARSEEAGGVGVDGALSGQNQAQSRQERSFDQGKRCDHNSVQKQNMTRTQIK